MKKKFLLTAALATAVIGLASCDDNKPAESGNDQPAKVQLKTMSMFGGTDPHAATYSKILSDFETANPNVSISDNSATSDEIWKTSVISTFYTGNEPDVLFYFTGNTAKPLVDNNKVVSVAEIRKAYPNYASNISESVIDPYAVTLKGFVEGMFVNTKLLKDNGLKTYADKDVWTWEDFMNVSDKLTKADKTPVAFGALTEPHYWIEHLILGMNGKESFTNIPSEKEFKSATGTGKTAADNWIKALMIMHDLSEKNVFGGSKGAQDASLAKQEFLNGNAGMYLDGSWFAGQIEDPNNKAEDAPKTVIKQADVKMIPFPAIPESMGGKNTVYMQSGFTSGFYISRKCWGNEAKRDAAVKLIGEMTKTASVKEFCKAGGVPADASVVMDGLTPLGNSMNTMAGRTSSATLPLGDSAKAQTFQTLVSAGAHYINGNVEGIKSALAEFASKQ